VIYLDSKDFGMKNQHYANTCSKCKVSLQIDAMTIVGGFLLNPDTDRFEPVCIPDFEAATVGRVN
jgi:hypothetical protein